jgi:hypothetical protein
MWTFIEKMLKKKGEVESKCEHDWEKIKEDTSQKVYWSYVDNKYKKSENREDCIRTFYPYRAVCLKCGECKDIIREIEMAKEKKRARYELACKMFEEGCK